ncbi:hypothetical protein NA56DRAFT_697314 [Hyaloscypha hepaticicola]|uniref:Uncharacterized protein n=1 Tax=Hyaloscypha hepaticicola TaxID=2082293 RepID=A0A2J6QLN9_9HELO|nr:hypothetical protein NA56DRAFT_697314 [Hyaloscypha hepaticicola]
MVPHHGLTHLKEYDIKDSNIELIGTEIDHKIKYNSEATEPALNNGLVASYPISNLAHLDFSLLHSSTPPKPPPKPLSETLSYSTPTPSSSVAKPQDEAGQQHKPVELDEFLETCSEPAARDPGSRKVPL